jgi:uncharacterized membrane protein
MFHAPVMTGPDPERDAAPTSSVRLGVGGWIAVLVLAGFLVWAGWYAVHAWTALSGVAISPLGWLFMSLGVVVTFALGAGLMALVFYSSRHHYDQ